MGLHKSSLTRLLVLCLVLYSRTISCHHRTKTTGKSHHPRLAKRVIGAIRAALKSAVDAEQQVNALAAEFNSDTTKAAWADCSVLYATTIFRLNQTLLSHATDWAKTQTLLSGALTNIEMCRWGLLKLTSKTHARQAPPPQPQPQPRPPMIDGLSRLIGDALALNDEDRNSTDQFHGHNFGNSGDRDYFPAWAKRPKAGKVLQTLTSASSRNPQCVLVAKDGSAKFWTVNEAIKYVMSTKRIGARRICVKAGTYEEYVEIGVQMTHFMLVGDGIGKTIITGHKSVKSGSTTYNSATVAILGDHFMAVGITFRNTAGPWAGQAVAVRCEADQAVFYQCSFEGYQDTLCAHTFRQFYQKCVIYGTIDFIFGNALALFQSCWIVVRNPPPQHQAVVTANARFQPNMNTGFCFHRCSVEAAPELNLPGYLGRPWGNCSLTVFLKCRLDRSVRGAGWMAWGNKKMTKDVFYGENGNYGQGSDLAYRLRTPAFHVLSDSQARKFTIINFLGRWVRRTSVSYYAGL